jgi:periplasmic protein TonB
MKYNILIFISLFIIEICEAQVIPDSIKTIKNYQEVKPSEPDLGFSLIDSYPMYPYGREGIKQLIIDNIHYPAKAKKKRIEGEVIIQFTIGIDGFISSIEVIKSVNKELDIEAIRVLMLMERWEPAYQRGSPVKYTLTQSIMFKL